MRVRHILFLGVLFLGGSLVAMADYGTLPFHAGRLALDVTHRLEFGSSGLGTTGWQMPADTAISTSYTTNHSLTRFIIAHLYVFQISPGTVLQLGLYLDNHLGATRKYDQSSYGGSASPVGPIVQGVANFDMSVIGFSVSDFPLSATYPSGTTVTVTAWVSNPIWVQIDNNASSLSYETFGLSSYSPPSTVSAQTGTIAPHTLSVGIGSYAE